MQYLKQNWLTMVTSVMLVVPAVHAEDAPGTLIDDTVITTKVKASLIESPVTKARQIDVDTKNGVVQLNGFVDTLEQKLTAEKIAGGIKDVKQVQNNLQLRGGEASVGTRVDDSVISGKVKGALLADSRTSGAKIDVKTNQGVVALGGWAGSAQERTTAETLARSVAGVIAVQNNIQVGRLETSKLNRVTAQ